MAFFHTCLCNFVPKDHVDWTILKSLSHHDTSDYSEGFFSIVRPMCGFFFWPCFGFACSTGHVQCIKTYKNTCSVFKKNKLGTTMTRQVSHS